MSNAQPRYIQCGKPEHGNRKAFVVITVSNRVDDLNELLQTIEQYIPDYDTWDVCVYMQDNLKVVDRVDKSRITKLFVVPEMIGCHAARLELLKRIQYDVYCNLDDDVRLTQYTHYEPAVRKCLEPTTGFVLTEQVRYAYLLPKAVPKMQDVFVEHILCHNAGGMLYNDNVANVIRQLPDMSTVFDDCWSVSVYLHGYTNYLYKGSVSIHNYLTGGGMKSYYKSVDYNKLPVLFSEYINYRVDPKTHEWILPEDKDLNERAHALHRANYAKLKGDAI